MTAVEAWTDGACRGNPGPGGWGVLLRAGGRERELKGAEPLSTNNRMELVAAIRALEALNRPCTVDLYTDSQYVRGGITEWLAGWKRNGWRTAGRKPVKNQDLWQALEAAATRHEVRWHWVKGHSGHPENERVDALANEAIDELLAGEKRSLAETQSRRGIEKIEETGKLKMVLPCEPDQLESSQRRSHSDLSHTSIFSFFSPRLCVSAR